MGKFTNIMKVLSKRYILIRKDGKVEESEKNMTGTELRDRIAVLTKATARYKTVQSRLRRQKSYIDYIETERHAN